MSTKITRVSALEIRFPRSPALDGSAAAESDPDHSAAYVVLGTDRPDGLEGHGLTFTIGGSNGIWGLTVETLEHKVLGLELEAVKEDMAGFWRHVTTDSTLRWAGPERGAIHLASAALVNAVWDLCAKSEGKPLWKLLVDMSPKEIVDCIDFRYIADSLSPEEAFAILDRMAPTRAAREAEMRHTGYPAYMTSLSRLGCDDEELRAGIRQAAQDGWAHFKIKVGRNIDDDIRRAAIVREQIGPRGTLMMDANQGWEVDEAIANIGRLAEFEPWWIEEPTNPDDMLGHTKIARAIMPIGIAIGAHCQSQVVFRQLLEANAVSFCQPDSCRLRGINETLAVMLMAAKFGVPVCPHAAGVGLCEYAQHLSLIDYICISGSLQDRVLEYVDYLHEHFLDSVMVRGGRYMPPVRPGYSIQMKPDSLRAYAYPNGSAQNG